jgi:hypothetical protein
MIGRAILLVRAELKHAADRAAFDKWYDTEHLPDALKTFEAERAWRCWSETTPLAHYAFYQFADMAAARSVLDSAGIRLLATEFDRVWGSRTVRAREILEVVQDQSV